LLFGQNTGLARKYGKMGPILITACWEKGPTIVMHV
jgi:hypothetical protein